MLPAQANPARLAAPCGSVAARPAAAECRTRLSAAQQFPRSDDDELPREGVDAFVPGFGHDEGVAEKNAKTAVRRDRVWLGHEHHAGPEHALERLGVDAIGKDVRAIGDEIDAMGMDRARLHALLAEEFAGRRDGLDRIARLD